MIVVSTNQKGGVAKTSTCLEFAYNLASKGYRVLLGDTDPQANLSKAVNGEGISYDHGTMADLLKSQEPIFDPNGEHYQGPIYQVNMGIDIIPSPPRQMLASVEVELSSVTGREFRLKDSLEVLLSRQQYDFVIIDTPPSLNVLTINALTAADKVLVPCIPEDFSVEGILQLNQTVRAVKRFCNPALEYDGILLTRVFEHTNAHKAYGSEAAKYSEGLNIYMYKTMIPSTIKVPESQGKRKPLAVAAADGTATEMYAAFTNEFLDNNNYPRKKGDID